jgi:hypothetical protein
MSEWAAGLLMASAVLPVSAAFADAGVAAGAAPSDAEAEAAYRAAQQAFQASRQHTADPSATMPVPPEVVVFSDPHRHLDRTLVAGTDRPHNASIENIRVVMDVENTSLREIVNDVVKQAARFTGPWQVKWRLKPEDQSVMDERVNLTAEAPFGEFVNLLTERVKNMTGVQLFVTTFNEARIIMVADTYY